MLGPQCGTYVMPPYWPPRISRCRLDFWKICAPLAHGAKFNIVSKNKQALHRDTGVLPLVRVGCQPDVYADMENFDI